MQKKIILSAAFAGITLGLSLAGCSSTTDSDDGAGKNGCDGKNSCKSENSCKAENSCDGKNSCKGENGCEGKNSCKS